MDREREPSSEGARENESPHDILAAEAFAMGEADPVLHREPAHDILAAEAFAMPSADRGTRHTPPDEHTGDSAAHDVLSAEEYAMPAGAHHAVPPYEPAGGARSRSWIPALVGVLVGLIAARALVRAVRRRRD